MNDLLHLEQSGQRPSCFTHSNWCPAVEIRVVGNYKVTHYSAALSRELEKVCGTCQNRFLHKLISLGCGTSYGVTYKKKEDV